MESSEKESKLELASQTPWCAIKESEIVATKVGFMLSAVQSFLVAVTVLFSLHALAKASPKIASVPCPENIEKLKDQPALTSRLKKNVTEVGALQCRNDGVIQLAGAEASLFTVTAKELKSSLRVVVPAEGDVFVIQSETKTMEATTSDVFKKALPLAREMTVWKNILKHDYELVDGDLCLTTRGPETTLKGLVQICAKTAKSLKTKEPIALASGMLSLEKAQQIAVKEFARLEKEEEVPSVKEIFGDKDSVMRLALAPEGKNSYYFFWVSQFSDSGIILMAVFMDGNVKSEIVKGVFEYDPKVVSNQIQKWLKEAK